MVYEWRSFKYPVKAQTVGEEFERIEKKYGELVPENVVDEARSEKSKIHPLFEWDDTKAADKYRVNQARQYINAIVIKADREDGTQNVVAAFVNVSESVKGRFINVQTAMREQESRETVLKRAMGELRALKRKYADLSEFAAAIDAAEREIKAG